MKTWLGASALRAIGSMPCVALATLVTLAGLSTAYAQTGKQPWEEYDKVIQARGVVTAHGPDIFGDQVDLYSGALSFSVTDISLTEPDRHDDRVEPTLVPPTMVGSRNTAVDQRG